MNTKNTLKIIISTSLFFSSCNNRLIYPASTPEFSAPPVEGDSIAPSLKTSVDEILNDSITPTEVCVKNGDIEVLECYNIDGELISSVQVPGIGSADPQGLYLAGAAGSGIVPPVVYFSWDPEQSLLKSENGTALPLRKTNSFLAMAGVPEEPVLAFSDMVFEDNIPHSYLYAGSLQALGNSNPFFEILDTKMEMVLMPVAVEAVGSQAGKVWYTHSAWEISGEERVFPINRGLYVFDLVTGQNSQLLGAERNFQGLSPDKAQAGSISIDFKGDHSMRVTNLLSGRVTNFPLDPTNDRGAGYAVFSIDGTYTAWVETGGSLIAGPPDFMTRIRIGNIEKGTVIQELESSWASKVLGWDWVSFMRPVGWLNAQTLIIEVNEGNLKTAALIKYDISDESLQLLCMGSFASFSYP